MSTHMCLEKNSMNVIRKAATAFAKRWRRADGNALLFKFYADTVNGGVL